HECRRVRMTLQAVEKVHLVIRAKPRGGVSIGGSETRPRTDDEWEQLPDNAAIVLVTDLGLVETFGGVCKHQQTGETVRECQRKGLDSLHEEPDVHIQLYSILKERSGPKWRPRQAYHIACEEELEGLLTAPNEEVMESMMASK